MSPPGREPDHEYFATIERHFGLRRGGRLVLSPRDFQLLQGWFDRGIPSEAVKRGINRAFDRFTTSRRTAERINSLKYCEQHVEEAWLQLREETAGSTSPDQLQAAAAEHLARAAAASRATAATHPDMATALEQCAGGLDDLAARASAGMAVDEIDRRARELESTIRAVGGERALGLPPFSPWA